MRFSIWFLVHIVSQVQCLWALASESKASGHFIAPKDGSHNIYWSGQQVHVEWWIPDNHNTVNFGVVGKVNGTSYYGGQCKSKEQTKGIGFVDCADPNSHLANPRIANGTRLIEKSWHANTGDCPHWSPSRRYRFFVNATDAAGAVDYFESAEWQLVRKGSNSSLTPDNGSHSRSLSTATSTVFVSASKTYNSATLTAPPTETTTNSDTSDSLSKTQNLHKSVLALTALAGSYIVLV
ncbi:hypothetical protein KEM54_000307 [Ascosphaera aggregata]|nr:hypothetical protein KEM54_000307 [Ascosphaera aggregata]